MWSSPLVELELEDLLHRPADHVEVTEPGELARAAAGADQASLLVEEEEGRVGGRVVVVEQLEEEAEAALACSACARVWKPAVRSRGDRCGCRSSGR